MKLLMNVVKKIVIAIFIIYAFNFIVTGLNIFIPINFVTIPVVAFLGIPGLLALIGIFFILK